MIEAQKHNDVGSNKSPKNHVGTKITMKMGITVIDQGADKHRKIRLEEFQPVGKIVLQRLMEKLLEKTELFQEIIIRVRFRAFDRITVRKTDSFDLDRRHIDFNILCDELALLNQPAFEADLIPFSKILTDQLGNLVPGNDIQEQSIILA